MSCRGRLLLGHLNHLVTPGVGKPPRVAQTLDHPIHFYLASFHLLSGRTGRVPPLVHVEHTAMFGSVVRRLHAFGRHLTRFMFHIGCQIEIILSGSVSSTLRAVVRTCRSESQANLCTICDVDRGVPVRFAGAVHPG